MVGCSFIKKRNVLVDCNENQYKFEEEDIIIIICFFLSKRFRYNQREKTRYKERRRLVEKRYELSLKYGVNLYKFMTLDQSFSNRKGRRKQTDREREREVEYFSASPQLLRMHNTEENSLLFSFPL